MTNHPDPDSDNTQPIEHASPKNDHPGPADAPTMLPVAGGTTCHPSAEAATLPPPSSAAGYSAAEDATLPRSAMGQASLGGSSPTSVKYFGDYELLSEIARGGMGVVYKARQKNLNRLVALKMILAGQLASDEDVKRFYTEAEAAAALEHPGIVPIFEIGQHNDQHFFSMGFVDGGSLADKIKEGPLPSKEAAAYTKKVAEAIAYAHSKGVIHRDLKPANILLDRNDEPKVTDFGLARRTESNSDLTRTGAVMGTPSYMPPEQAAGRTDQVGPLADVYSLGAILYCLLTGRPPFQASNPLDTLMQVMEREPVSVTTLNPGTHRDLETICQKCLQKDPAKRYASAQELADDLGRWLNGEPIRARAVSSSERAWRWVKRHRTVSALIVATTAAVLIGSAVSIWFGLEATREAKRAEREAKRALLSKNEAEESREEAMREAQIAKQQRAMAESNLEKAEVSNYVNLFTSATSAFSEDRYDKAWWLLKQCPPHLRGWEHRYLRSIYDNSRQTIRTFDSSIRDIYYSSDGKRLWTNTLGGPTPWDSVTGRKIEGDSKMVQMGSYFKVSPDGTKAFSSSQSWDSDKSVWIHSHRLVDLSSGISELSFEYPNEISAASFSPDGSRLVLGLVNVVPETPQPTVVSEEYKTARAPMILKVLDSTNGNLIATITCDFEPLRGWSSGERESRVNSVVFDSAARHVLAAINAEGEDYVYVFDLETGERTLSLSLPSADRCKRFAAYSPDERYILTGGERVYANVQPSVDSQVQLWDASTGDFVKSFGEPRIWLESIAISPDSQVLAIASENGQCVLWHIETGERLQTLIGQQVSVRKLTFSPDGRRLAACCSDGTIKTWEVIDLATPVTEAIRPMVSTVIQMESAYPNKAFIGFSGNWQRWGSGGYVLHGHAGENLLYFWSARKRCQSALIDYPRIKNSPAISSFSRDGTKVATCTSDGDARLWDFSTGKELAQLYFKDTWTNSEYEGGLWLSPDAKYIAVKRNTDIRETERGRSSTSDNDEIEFRSILEGGTTWSVPRGQKVAFTEDSSRVIVLKNGNRAELYSLVDGTLKQSIDVQMPGFINVVVISPDGSLAAFSNGDLVNVVNTNNGELQSTIRDKEGEFREILFSPDSKRLVTCHSHLLKIWSASSGHRLLTLQRAQHSPSLGSAVFSDDGNQIVSISDLNDRGATFEIWDCNVGADNPMIISDEMIASSSDIGFNHDGTILVARSFGGVRKKAWNTQTGRPVSVPDSPVDFTRRTASFGRHQSYAFEGELHLIDALKDSFGTEPWPWPDDSDQREYYLRNADKAEQDQRWHAAAWHLHRCLTDDQSSDLLRERIARIQAQVKKP